MSDRRIITVFGTSKAKSGEVAYETAFELGKSLGAAGYDIANGGYGGTMESGAKGASSSNSRVYGVTCSAFGRNGPNEFVTDVLESSCLAERLAKLIEIGDGYIALPGGTGTLLEVAEVWELKNKKFFKEDKPIVLLGDFWKPLVDMMGFEDAKSLRCIYKAKTVHEAIEILNGHFSNLNKI